MKLLKLNLCSEIWQKLEKESLTWLPFWILPYPQVTLVIARIVPTFYFSDTAKNSFPSASAFITTTSFDNSATSGYGSSNKKSQIEQR